MYSLSAFKPYDIRGVWQTEIDETLWRVMGYGLGLHLIEKYQTPKILISSDVREANMAFIDEFLRGMKIAGIDEVTLIGQNENMPQYRYGVCSTPMAYYAAIDTFDCACIFTASHNPSEYVGIKIVDNKCLSIKSDTLRAIFEQHEHDVIQGGELPSIKPYTDSRITELLSGLKEKFQTLTKIPKITVDYSHGAASHFEQIFLREILWENAVHIFTTPDGSFPAHDTDTSRFKSYGPLIAEVQKNGSDFGFIFDGDADRFGMVIPDGTVVTGDILLAIIARELLTDGTAERLGSKEIFHEVCCGRIIGDVVKKLGGNVHITQVGRESFVREVIEKNGLVAGEVSTHLLFKEYGTIEMPLAGLFYLIKALEKYENATALIKEFDVYARGQIFQFKTDKKDDIIQALKERYNMYEQITIDGVRVEATDFWFTVRKSNTEPLLKLSIETKTPEKYTELLEELRAFFSEYEAVEKL
jgi:phosphomannomutase